MGPRDSSRIDIDTKTEAVFRRKNYRIQSKLGAGAFGTVGGGWRGVCSRHSQVYKAERTNSPELAAVKVMDLTKMSSNYRAKFLPRELQALIETKHENIIEVFDIIRANKKLYIFMEFADNGDISGYVRKHDGVRLHLGCIWFLQLTNGLVHLHDSLYTCHRDIKLDNFLLSSKFIAKLSDFGFARISVDPNTNRLIMSQTYCGTLPYYSPQVLQKTPYNPFKSDVWSMGVSFYILIHNRFPYHHRDKKLMIQEMTRYPAYIQSRFNEKTPDQAKYLIENMLNPDENNRFSMKDVARNEWLQKITSLSNNVNKF